MLRKIVLLAAVAVGTAAFVGLNTNTAKALPFDTQPFEEMIEASPDSYPVLAIRTDKGETNPRLQVGDSVQFCALARNRYTGRVMTLLPRDITPAQEEEVARKCEVARQMYASELSKQSA